MHFHKAPLGYLEKILKEKVEVGSKMVCLGVKCCKVSHGAPCSLCIALQ